MKPAFTSSQEMYNYAANQLMNQNLGPETVKNNLMERGVTDADAEIVIQNMLVAIEKQKKAAVVEVDTKVAENAFVSRQENNKGSEYGLFATMQEMYNYAANQLIVEKLSQPTVKRNLLNKGVSDAEADSVIQNMMVQIEKNKPAESRVTSSNGSFASSQDMYNYAADQLIVKKLNPQVVKRNLVKQGVTDADADMVIKNMMEQIEKNKPIQAKAKKSEGRRMMLGGLVIGGIGAILYGTNFSIAGEAFVVSYGILAVGAIFFFKGLFKTL